MIDVDLVLEVSTQSILSLNKDINNFRKLENIQILVVSGNYVLDSIVILGQVKVTKV